MAIENLLISQSFVQITNFASSGLNLVSSGMETMGAEEPISALETCRLTWLTGTMKTREGRERRSQKFETHLQVFQQAYIKMFFFHRQWTLEIGYHDLLKTAHTQASARRVLPVWWLQSILLTTHILPPAVTGQQLEVMVGDPLGLLAARRE